MLSGGYTLSPLSASLRSVTETVDLASTSGEHQRGISHLLPGITLISEWPQGSFIENLAATHDGYLLVTVYSSNEIYQIDPQVSRSNRTLLATFPSGPTGIAELDFNHFYINVGSIGQRNTWNIYALSLHPGTSSNVSQRSIVSVDSALYLNGLCVLSYEHGTLLSVDSMLGQIFKINIHTKQAEVWYENDLLKRRSHDVHVPGVNGIRRCAIDGCVYLTNTDRAIILRLEVDPFDYRPRGQLETIVRNIVCDDFTIDRTGAIYATTHAHSSLMRLTPVKDGEYLREEIATEGLAGATSCVFGRTYQDRTRCSSIFNAIRTRGGSNRKIDRIIFIGNQPKQRTFSCVKKVIQTIRSIIAMYIYHLIDLELIPKPRRFSLSTERLGSPRNT